MALILRPSKKRSAALYSVHGYVHTFITAKEPLWPFFPLMALLKKDFAGQDLYQTTHSFFISTRAVYLLVFSLANDEDASIAKLDYWLHSLEARAKVSSRSPPTPSKNHIHRKARSLLSVLIGRCVPISDLVWKQALTPLITMLQYYSDAKVCKNDKNYAPALLRRLAERYAYVTLLQNVQGFFSPFIPILCRDRFANVMGILFLL